MHNAKPSADIVLIGENGGERETLRNALVGRGHAVSAVSDAEAFLSLIKEMTPRLIIVADSRACPADVALVRRLKVSERTEDIPILFICDAETGFDWASGWHGMADRLCRPYTREMFLERVKLLAAFADMRSTLAQVHRQFGDAQKMECLGALASGVVHEINNLMFSVMGFAELALENDGSDIEILKESARMAHSCGRRATDVAAGLLAFARQSPGQKTRGDFNDVVTASAKLLRRDLTAHKIRLEMNLGELPPTRFAFGSMQQVLLNLFINAWQAMTEQTGARVLTVTTSAEPDSIIRLTVADTGPGVPADLTEWIFEPFHTTKPRRETMDARGGSGLGLAMVKNIVSDHGGTVSVRNVPGKGAEFAVLLPVDDSEDELPELTESDEALSETSRSILVVDDEEAGLKALSRLLIRQGHDVCLAANMAEAVTLLWSRPIDLIAMDMMLPAIEGVSNIRRLREEGIKTPVLICTGCPDRTLIDEGLRDGANGAIVKPFTVAAFIREMESCLAAAKSAPGAAPDKSAFFDPATKRRAR